MCALQRREVPGAGQCGEQGQVAADETPTGHAAANGADAGAPGYQHAVGRGAPAELAGGGGMAEDTVEVIVAEGGERGAAHRPVEGDDAGRLVQRQEEGGDVGVADDRLGMAEQRLEVDRAEDPGDAVAAAQTPDGVDGGIAEGLVEVGEAGLVGAGEVAVAIEHVGAGHRLEVERLTEFDTALQVVALAERAGGRHQCDARAAPKPRRTDHRL